VPSGHRGVMTTFGKVNIIEKQEGIGLKIPIAQKVKKLEVRTQKLEVMGDSSSKDLQSVDTTIALNYHVEPSKAAELYQNIGSDYRSRVIDPAVQESIKSVSALYTAEELVTKRGLVRTEIKNELSNRLKEYNIVVDDFNIVNFQFSEEFDKAIESKVTAEQRKLQATMDLERIKIEKEQKITQAEAEAESIRIQSNALKANDGILELRWIEKWDGRTPQVTGSNSLINIGLD
jgi:regulator of protease activity HflC (stomatin/prohibitin superfamily)